MPVIVIACVRPPRLNEVLRFADGGSGTPDEPGGERPPARTWGFVPTPALASRLRRLPPAAVAGYTVRVAIGPRARLLGLALLDRAAAGPGLLIPGCRSVHTFGMRFRLDLVFLDRAGRTCSVRRGVPPGRIASDRRAVAVLELPSRDLRL